MSTAASLAFFMTWAKDVVRSRSNVPVDQQTKKASTGSKMSSNSARHRGGLPHLGGVRLEEGSHDVLLEGRQRAHHLFEHAARRG